MNRRVYPPRLRALALWLVVPFLLTGAGCKEDPDRVMLTCIKAGRGFGSVEPSAEWYPGRKYPVEKGQNQTLTAAPAPGSRFAGWRGDIPEGQDAKNATIAVLMDRDREIKAEFVREQCTLDYRFDGKPEEWVLLTPPGKLDYDLGDTTFLYAVPAMPNRRPVWTGKVERAGKYLAKITVTGDMTVSLDRQEADEEGDTAAPGIPLDPRKDPPVNVPLRGGNLSAWFSAPYVEQAPFGAGFSWFAHDRCPNTFPFRWVALNFEHVFNGVMGDKLRSFNTPRRDPMVLTLATPDTVRVHWPAEQSSWNMDCDMVYTLAAPDAVDVAFSCTPRKECAPLGYLALMWANYMSSARDGRFFFWGEYSGREGWCSLGEPLGDGGRDVGNVAFKGEPPLPYDPEVYRINVAQHPEKHFLKPLFYGLTDADQNLDTRDDTMVVIMMFDQTAPIRLALWNWTGNPHWPAWDWQFVIRNPVVDKTYSYRARMIYKPFIGREDVLAEYEHWRAGLPPAS